MSGVEQSLRPRSSLEPLLDERSEGIRRERLLGWIAARIVIAALLMGAAVLTRGAIVAMSSLSYAAALVFSASAFSALLVRFAPRFEGQLSLQPAFDLVSITALVYFFGGTNSGITALYSVTVLATAFVLGPRPTLFVTFGAVVLYTVIATSVGLGWMASPGGVVRAMAIGELALEVLRSLMGIVLVAALATTLSTRLARARREITVLREKAEQAERLAALGRLAAALAHEIRNPLGAISGSIELLNENKDLSEEDRKLLGIVGREIARLDETVATMLAVGRPRLPETRSVDLRKIAEDVVAMARRDRAAPPDLHIDVVSSEPEFMAHVDEAQGKQVLWNLLKNAIHASQRGGSIEVALTRSAEGDVISVSDHGAGIAPQDVSRVFEVFFTGRPQGTGLGLALVKQIVEAHGGRVHVQSELGKGTTFHAVFPGTGSADQ